MTEPHPTLSNICIYTYTDKKKYTPYAFLNLLIIPENIWNF